MTFWAADFVAICAEALSFTLGAEGGGGRPAHIYSRGTSDDAAWTTKHRTAEVIESTSTTGPSSRVAPCMQGRRGERGGRRVGKRDAGRLSLERRRWSCGCRICGGWWAGPRPGRSRWSPPSCRRCPGRGSSLPSRRWCWGSSACDRRSWARGNLITRD